VRPSETATLLCAGEVLSWHHLGRRRSLDQRRYEDYLQGRGQDVWTRKRDRQEASSSPSCAGLAAGSKAFRERMGEMVSALVMQKCEAGVLRRRGASSSRRTGGSETLAQRQSTLRVGSRLTAPRHPAAFWGAYAVWGCQAAFRAFPLCRALNALDVQRTSFREFSAASPST
jgi:hypothetical protein